MLVLKGDPGRRTLLHGEKRPQARVPGPIPGPLPHCSLIAAHVASEHRGQLLGAEQEAAAGRTPWSCPSHHMGLGPGPNTDGVHGKRREGKIEGLHASHPSLLMASRIPQHHALMYPCRFCDSEVTPSISDTRIPHCRTQLRTEAAAQCIPALSSPPFCHPALGMPVWGHPPTFNRVPPGTVCSISM